MMGRVEKGSVPWTWREINHEFQDTATASRNIAIVFQDTATRFRVLLLHLRKSFCICYIWTSSHQHSSMVAGKVWNDNFYHVLLWILGAALFRLLNS